MPRADNYNHFFSRCQVHINAINDLPPLRHVGDGRNYGVLVGGSETRRQPGFALTLEPANGAKADSVRVPVLCFELSTLVGGTEPNTHDDTSWRRLRGVCTSPAGWRISYGKFARQERRLCRCTKPLTPAFLVVGASNAALDAEAERTIAALLAVWRTLPR